MSSTVCADDSTDVESAAAAAAEDTKPDDGMECSVPVTSELSQDSVLSTDADCHQSALGRFTRPTCVVCFCRCCDVLCDDDDDAYL